MAMVNADDSSLYITYGLIQPKSKLLMAQSEGGTRQPLMCSIYHMNRMNWRGDCHADNTVISSWILLGLCCPMLVEGVIFRSCASFFTTPDLPDRRANPAKVYQRDWVYSYPVENATRTVRPSSANFTGRIRPKFRFDFRPPVVFQSPSFTNI